MPMSNLRRRVLGDSSSASSSRSSSPAQAFEGDQQGDGSVSVPITKIEKINQQLQKAREAKHHAPKEHRKRRNAWIFGLGGLFGVLVALFFAGNNDVLDLHQALKNVNLDSLMDVLPVGFVKDAEELQVSALAQLRLQLYVCLQLIIITVEKRTRCCSVRFIRCRSACEKPRC